MKTAEALSKIESVFRRFAAAMPFDYHFADEDYAARSKTEERIGKLAGFFSALAMRSLDHENQYGPRYSTIT